MADFNKPDPASNYLDTFDELKALAISQALMFDGTTDINKPVGTIQWSSVNDRIEIWDGASSKVVTDELRMNVERLGGKTLAEILAMMADAGHVHDGMVTLADLADYCTLAQVDARIAAIPLGSDGTDHAHGDMVTTGTLTSYATVVYVDGQIEALDTRITALESRNFDDRYHTKTEATGLFQPKGEYLTTADAVTRDEIYLKGEIDTKFLDGETALDEKMDKTAGLADLSDVAPTPNTVVGFDGDGNAIERAVADVSGAKTMTELTDAPDTYTGNGGKMVLVKGDETGVEFSDREAAWNVITDELQFYGTSWELDGGEWAWRKQVGQYQLKGKVGIDNIGMGWYQFTTTGNISVPEASGQIVAVPAEKHDGTMVMAMARFWSATQIDIYIPEAIALNETIWFDFSCVTLNT
jgi:hypothetical protein